MSFTEKMSYWVGESLTAFTTEIPTWLDNGVRDVVQKMRAINFEYSRAFTVKATFDVAGLALSTGVPYAVTRKRTALETISPLCTIVDPDKIDSLQDDTSIYYATADYPAAYILGKTLFVLPVPVAGGAAAYVTTIGTVTDASETITNFPEELYGQVVLHACTQFLAFRIGNVKEELRAYLNEDHDSELVQLKTVELSRLDSLLVYLKSKYEEGFAPFGSF